MKCIDRAYLSCLLLYRAAVMEQRDPNTISGLLKLHLRERPFLCPRSIAQLDKVLQARDKVRMK